MIELFNPAGSAPETGTAQVETGYSTEEAARREQQRMHYQAIAKDKEDKKRNKEEILAAWEELTAFERQQLKEAVMQQHGAIVAERGEDSMMFITACVNERRRQIRERLGLF